MSITARRTRLVGRGHRPVARPLVRLPELADETLIVGDVDPASGFYSHFAALGPTRWR
jgi:hypothetical protein